MSHGPLLDVQDVERSFGGVKALQRMNLTVQPGESAALIGPNGSGKSTLVNVISRMVDVEKGSVVIDGVEVSRVRASSIASHGVARTFQHVRLVPELTLRENAASGGLHQQLARRGGRLRSWVAGAARWTSDPAGVEAALDLMEVPLELRDRVPGAASYAAQRHTEVARALVSEPRLLMLDEPVAGMNPAEVGTFLRLMRKINEAGIATLLIDHNIDFVMKAATNVTVINRGQRIASGSADSVRRDPAVVEAYLGARHAAPEGRSQ